MSDTASDNPSEVDRLILRAASGDPEGWRAQLDHDCERLRRMGALRMDRRLQGRIDASHVIEGAYIEAMTRLREYLRESNPPFFLWLRLIVGQRQTLLHRPHLGAHERHAGQEIGLYHGPWPEASSAALAVRLLRHLTHPSAAAVRAERQIRIQSALNSMDQLDRKILALRHIEHLSNDEAAQALGLTKSAASKLYVGALQRLNKIVVAGRGGFSEL
jgi:RNA polymerase sigma-70 factor (ECF subfamily)